MALALAICMFTNNALASSTQDNFNLYLAGKVSSKEIAKQILSNPEEYRKNVMEIGEIISQNGLLTSDENIANKIYRLQSDLNDEILAHNKEVRKRRIKAGLIGAGVGVAAGFAGAIAKDRYSGGTLYAFVFDLVLFTTGGTVLGAVVANGIDHVTREGKFEQNDLLDVK